MNKLQTLIARKDAAIKKARAAVNALPEGVDFTDRQRDEQDNLLAQIKTLNSDIDRERELEALSLTAPAGTGPGAGGNEYYDGPGFKSFGDFARAVIAAGTGRGRVPQVDPRLGFSAAAPTNFANEASGSDGGFTVPRQFHDEIGGYVFEEPSLLDFCADFPLTAGNTLSIPIDEATPWGGSSVQVAWDGEAQQIDASKPVLEQREFRLRKLVGLVPCTNEVLEDSSTLARWLPRKLGAAVRWATNKAIVSGSGTNQPQGFTNSGAIVEQAKETSQTADTIVAGNITKMFGRNTAPSRAVWLINPDSFNQIPLLTIGDQPVWTAPTGMRDAPMGRLLGRPILMTDACATLGDAGDIYFCDLEQYGVVQKSGPKIMTSMHIWFDYDMTAFRVVFRVDGASLVRTPITPPNSSVTRSPFVRLGART